ncbi:hypothetical protein Trydic_g18847 [Trypoxylus dichotomus]
MHLLPGSEVRPIQVSLRFRKEIVVTYVWAVGRLCFNALPFVVFRLAYIRNHIVELPNRYPSIFQHCPGRYSSWTSVRPSLNCLYYLHIVRSDTFIHRFHTVGNEYPAAQCFLQIKNQSQSVICTWRERRMGAPFLTAAKPRLRIVDNSSGWGLSEGETGYMQVSPDLA